MLIWPWAIQPMRAKHSKPWLIARLRLILRSRLRVTSWPRWLGLRQ
jgi:hypothetical protein